MTRGSDSSLSMPLTMACPRVIFGDVTMWTVRGVIHQT